MDGGYLRYVEVSDGEYVLASEALARIAELERENDELREQIRKSQEWQPIETGDKARLGKRKEEIVATPRKQFTEKICEFADSLPSGRPFTINDILSHYCWTDSQRQSVRLAMSALLRSGKIFKCGDPKFRIHNECTSYSTLPPVIEEERIEPNPLTLFTLRMEGVQVESFPA